MFLGVGGLFSLIPDCQNPSFPQVTESKDYPRKQWGSRHVEILSPTYSISSSPGLHSHRGHFLHLLLYEFALRENSGNECLKPNPTAAVFLPSRNHSLFLLNIGHSKKVAFCLNWEQRWISNFLHVHLTQD